MSRVTLMRTHHIKHSRLSIQKSASCTAAIIRHKQADPPPARWYDKLPALGMTRATCEINLFGRLGWCRLPAALAGVPCAPAAFARGGDLKLRRVALSPAPDRTPCLQFWLLA